MAEEIVLEDPLAGWNPQAEEPKRCAFGPWKLDRQAGILAYTEGTYTYEVWTEQARTADQKLDWIDHLMGKAWLTPEVLYAFVEALREVR